MSSKRQWTSRTVIDAAGEAGSVDLDEEPVARAQLADWLDAGYDLDEDDEAWIMDALTDKVLTYEDRGIALSRYGLVVEFDN